MVLLDIRHPQGEQGDDGPIGPGEAGTGDLAAQHEDFRVLGIRLHVMDPDQVRTRLTKR